MTIGGRAVQAQGGTRTVPGTQPKYYRSKMEYNIACYLQFLKRSATDVVDWKHEPEEFLFKEIKRGMRFYKPDFKVTLMCGRKPNRVEYWEVKGWMDPKSQTQLARMKRYYPDVNVVVVDPTQYKAIAEKAALIPGWER